ncbi:hypothetical protein [Burkholderia cepacia]|uniref:hypothetical protein n=1 Tax=Burkholderia cepacia TaxID=292 RepID=UPI0012D8C8EE|nr:hypothetical protein [Burkholderia cepacia]
MELNILNRISAKAIASVAFCVLQFVTSKVFAYDPNGNPFKPPGCQGKVAQQVDTVEPTMFSFGDKIYLVANVDSWLRGGVVGVVDIKNPINTSVALTIRSGIDYYYFAISSIGYWLENNSGQIASVAVPKGQDIRDPNLTYGTSYISLNQDEDGRTYNGLSLFGSINTWHNSSSGASPNGTQVMHLDGKNLFTQSVISKTPVEFAAMYVKGMYNYKSWGVPGGPMMKAACDIGGEYAVGRTFFNFLSSNELKIAAPTGKIEITSGNVIYSVPNSCSIRSEGVSCPFTVVSAPTLGRNSFTLSIPSSRQADYWFSNNISKLTRIDVADIRNYSFVMSKSYLNSVLGENESVDRFDDLTLELRAVRGNGELGALIQPMDSVSLKRLTFGVALTERDPAAAGQYSGKVGQDPEIAVPLRIEQYGVSKASKVTVTVVADNVATPKGMRCKFVGNDGATVVGISASLRFYNGNRQDEQSDNCMGAPHDITKMIWKPVLGGGFPYQASLDTDLFFPIGYRDVHQDINGNEWYGRVTASGQVKVKAEWN